MSAAWHSPTRQSIDGMSLKLTVKMIMLLLELFSGATLEWLSTCRPEQRGQIIFLFVCGEMIDAYQNRSLWIEEHIQMILRAHFFLELWEKFLEVGGYSKKKHYVSSQYASIVKTLIQGFLQLVVIYRDHGGQQPLLPWLLCMEAVEHVFGLCRQIVKDFTERDFHLMIPKLFIKLQEAFFSGRISNGKARASGYCHTHTDTHGINLAALATFPTDDEIQASSVCAYGEAHSIFMYLGLTAEQLYGSVIRLPTIPSWYTTAEDSDSNHDGSESESVNDDDSEPGLEDDDSEPGLEDDYDYQASLDRLENVELATERENQRLMNYRYAMTALTVDEEMSMQVADISLSHC